MTTHIGFVLDMSGSMGVIKEATKEGTIAYVKELRKTDSSAKLSLTAFDTILERWVDDEVIRNVKINNVMESYHPRGGTALYDALGDTINRIAKHSREKIVPGDGLRNKVVIVVMTDGQENSSRTFSRGSINDLVRKFTKRGNWTFVYLGANVDAWAEARSMGIAAGNTMAYSTSRGSAMSALTSTARATGMHVNSAQGATSSLYKSAGVAQDVRDEDDLLIKIAVQARGRKSPS